MGKFYCISREQASPLTIKLLKEACKKRKIAFVLINSESYDFSQPLTLKNGDILYKVSTDERSTRLFKTLLHEGVVTIYKSLKDALRVADTIGHGALLHEKHGLPIIKTIFDLPEDKKLLKAYAKKLGGFPIIIKATGGSHGIGVMKIDSLESLHSVADYLLAQKNKGQTFILRQYIDYNICARLIVLDGEVIGSLKYDRVKDDFRSNTGNDLRAKHQVFNKQVQKLAIEAVKISMSDFGGVDILIDNSGKAFIAEVNTPCAFFTRTQLLTGVDTAGKIINSLRKKAEKIK